MAEHQEIVDYLAAVFPAAQVHPPRGSTGPAASVFLVTEGAVERQLEISRPILDDFKGPSVVQLLRTNRIAETMRDQPGQRVVLNRDKCEELLVLITPVRTPHDPSAL